jgi:hypothetical protein
VKKLVTGVVTIMIPMVAYATTYLISFDHIIAILVMGGAAISELALAVYLIKHKN